MTPLPCRADLSGSIHVSMQQAAAILIHGQFHLHIILF